MNRKLTIFFDDGHEQVFQALSPVYKTPPGIKELEDALREVKGHRMHEVRHDELKLVEEGNVSPEESKAFLRGLYEIPGKNRIL